APRSDTFKHGSGVRLTAVRHALGLTQEALAAQLGCSRPALANWENGDRLPDINAMVRLRLHYGIPLDYIFIGALHGIPADLLPELQSAAADDMPRLASSAAPGLAEGRTPWRPSRKRTKRS
ncbi:MAG: helix-turn-helix domain-containing protein, partial [Roseicyclus sp.]